MNLFELFLIAILLGGIIGVIAFYITKASYRKHEKKTLLKGGCKASRWGCCPDKIIPKYDLRGTNCVPKLNITTTNVPTTTTTTALPTIPQFPSIDITNTIKN